MSRLAFKNLTKSFEEKRLFSDLTFSFPQTGLFLILGKSGTGKTTLLRMIAGLDTDFAGRIEGGGADAVSFVFQEARLFPSLTAIRNVSEVLRAAGMSREAAEKAAEETLLAIGFPEGDLKSRPAALSGGMCQRVALARAIAAPRGILLLDEPERGLDEPLRLRLYERIAAEAKRRLVLVVTHTPERLLPISDGTLTIEGEN